jgi:hypothetical protein
MTTQDKVKVIAEYDGWVDDMHNMYVNPNYNKGTLMYLSDMPYLTSLDSLHSVAMKVLDGLFVRDLIDNEEAQWSRATIRQYCATKPINGEYIDLFNAVYDGIIFLNSNK